MDVKKIIEKLEMDLSAFMISEIPKEGPSLTQNYRQVYLYKGLSISANLTKPIIQKSLSIRIGALEAEFRADTGERVSGSLTPDDEHLVRVWLSQSKNMTLLRALFRDDTDEVKRKIDPIDLEGIFTSEEEDI